MSTKDWIEKDFYQSLGVAKDATAADIKKTYRKLARELHPDKNPGDAAAESALQGGVRGLRRALRPRQAQGVRRGPRAVRRRRGHRAAAMPSAVDSAAAGAAVDRRRRAASTCPTCSAAAGAAARRAATSTTCSTACSGRTPAPPADPAGRGPQRGQDVTADVTLGFEEAVQGDDAAAAPVVTGHLPGVWRQRVRAPARARGAARHVWRHRRIISDNQGAFGFSQPCRDCRGTGQLIDDPCPECRGSGTTTQHPHHHGSHPDRHPRRREDPRAR